MLTDSTYIETTINSDRKSFSQSFSCACAVNKKQGAAYLFINDVFVFCG